MARRDVIVAVDGQAPRTKSAMHALLTGAVAAAHLPDVEIRLVLAVTAQAELTVQARAMVFREFPAARPQLRLVVRPGQGAPAGILRSARAAGIDVVTR